MQDPRFGESARVAPGIHRLLMVCYLFPPAGGPAIPAVQRAVKFVTGLSGTHWQPVVLTVQPDRYETYLPREPRFIDELPAALRVERTGRVMLFKRGIHAAHALRALLRGAPPAENRVAVAKQDGAFAESPADRTVLSWFKRTFEHAVQLPDPHIGWLPHAYVRGRSIIRRGHADCIYATGFPWSALLLGTLLKRSTHVPLVLDFRDPWVTNPYRANFPRWRKRLETWLERFVIASADVVIANTRSLCDELQQRYPDARGTHFEPIYNSVDWSGPVAPVRRIQGLPVTLVHTGFLYGPRDPRTFLRALAKWRRLSRFGHVSDLVVEFVGETNLPYSFDGLIRELDLDGVVRLLGPVSHESCANILSDASAFLLLQPGTKTQLPSKLFEYARFGKPVLAVAEPGGETYRFARDELHSVAVSCADEDDIVNGLDVLVENVRKAGGSDPGMCEALMNRYSPQSATRQLIGILDALAPPNVRSAFARTTVPLP